MPTLVPLIRPENRFNLQTNSEPDFNPPFFKSPLRIDLELEVAPKNFDFSSFEPNYLFPAEQDYFGVFEQNSSPRFEQNYSSAEEQNYFFPLEQNYFFQTNQDNFLPAEQEGFLSFGQNNLPGLEQTYSPLVQKEFTLPLDQNFFESIQQGHFLPAQQNSFPVLEQNVFLPVQSNLFPQTPIGSLENDIPSTLIVPLDNCFSSTLISPGENRIETTPIVISDDSEDDINFAEGTSPNSRAACLLNFPKRISRKITKSNNKRSPKRCWTSEEDGKLLQYYKIYGPKWAQIAKQIPYRTGKQVRDRYRGSLAPNIKRGDWTEDEDRILLKMFEIHGPHWQRISENIEGRPEIHVKNRYNKHLKKQFVVDQKNQDYVSTTFHSPHEMIIEGSGMTFCEKGNWTCDEDLFPDFLNELNNKELRYYVLD